MFVRVNRWMDVRSSEQVDDVVLANRWMDVRSSEQVDGCCSSEQVDGCSF